MTTETARPTRTHFHQATRRDHARSGWVLKSCARCGGDLIMQTDEYGDKDLVCLQCGHSRPLDMSPAAVEARQQALELLLQEG